MSGLRFFAFFFFVTAVMLVAPGVACQDQTSAENSQDAALTSLKKSLLIPGWGQFSERRYLEGALFLGSEILCLYQIFSNNRKGNTEYRRYRDAESVADAVRFRQRTEEFDKKRNLYIMGAVGVWALNLLDIYVIVRNKPKQKLELRLKSGDFQTVLSLRFSF